MQEKQITPENTAPKIKVLHFKPEGYVHPDDADFLEQFIEFLHNERYDGRLTQTPDQLVYSGVDVSKIYAEGVNKRPDAVFGMNEISWKRNASKSYGETTPGGYAKDATIPAIFLYDRDMLAHAESYQLHLDPNDPNQIVGITDIVPGRPLAGEHIDDPVEEAVIHKDFPHKSPVDAQVGIVYIGD
jgi:hypothetical protein